LKKSDIAGVLHYLADLDQQNEVLRKRVPETILSEEDWQGLAFVIDGVKLVTAMNEIRELLPYPDSVTQVPGSIDWMVGLANIRGELLPIVDLQNYFGGASTVPNDSVRILVVRSGELASGLLVPSIIGMRHFPRDKLLEDVRVEGAMGTYIYDVFGMDDMNWPVFSIAGLVNDPRFMVAAA
jgi:twitching motility protein PilI